jgi:hypothetical protein
LKVRILLREKDLPFECHPPRPGLAAAATIDHTQSSALRSVLRQAAALM